MLSGRKRRVIAYVNVVSLNPEFPGNHKRLTPFWGLHGNGAGRLRVRAHSIDSHTHKKNSLPQNIKKGAMNRERPKPPQIFRYVRPYLNPGKEERRAAATNQRMMAAGTAAIAHLTMSRTIERNGMSKSVITTLCGGDTGLSSSWRYHELRIFL